METNSKVLYWLMKLIDVALVLIIVSVGATVLMTKNAFDLPNFPESTEKILAWVRTMTLFSTFLVIASGIFYGTVLLQVRKILKSIMEDGLFQMKQVRIIKKASALYLVLAGLALCFNLILVVNSIQNDNPFMLKTSSLNLASIFERFVLAGLVIFGLAQVFLSRSKMKTEQYLIS